jgi:NADPH2:quinone reductase
MTAHYLSQAAYPVQPGETVLVHAGAGGVGQLLTQMAKLRGGRVICTVSTAQKEKLARDNGADEVIRYTETDFAAEVARLTSGAGVAAIYDGVGGATFDRNLASLAPRGVLAIYGQAGGPIPPFDPARLVQAGSVYLTRTSLVHYARSPQALRARATDVFDLVQSGQVRVHVGGRYALADARSAHRQMERPGLRGRPGPAAPATLRSGLGDRPDQARTGPTSETRSGTRPANSSPGLSTPPVWESSSRTVTGIA